MSGLPFSSSVILSGERYLADGNLSFSHVYMWLPQQKIARSIRCYIAISIAKRRRAYKLAPRIDTFTKGTRYKSKARQLFLPRLKGEISCLFTLSLHSSQAFFLNARLLASEFK